MARVIFSSEQQQLTGVRHYTFSSRNYRDLLAELLLAHAALDKTALGDMAIVIDGVIIPDPLLETFKDQSEVHFIHFLAAG